MVYLPWPSFLLKVSSILFCNCFVSSNVSTLSPICRQLLIITDKRSVIIQQLLDQTLKYKNTFDQIILCKRTLQKNFSEKPAKRTLENNLEKILKKSGKNFENTAGPWGTRPRATRASTVHGFELGPKIFEIRGFEAFSLRTAGFSQGLTVKKYFSNYCLVGST